WCAAGQSPAPSRAAPSSPRTSSRFRRSPSRHPAGLRAPRVSHTVPRLLQGLLQALLQAHQCPDEMRLQRDGGARHRRAMRHHCRDQDDEELRHQAAIEEWRGDVHYLIPWHATRWMHSANNRDGFATALNLFGTGVGDFVTGSAIELVEGPGCDY